MDAPPGTMAVSQDHTWPSMTLIPTLDVITPEQLSKNTRRTVSPVRCTLGSSG